MSEKRHPLSLGQVRTAALRRKLEDCERKVQALLLTFPSLKRARRLVDPPHEQEYVRLLEERDQLRLELIRRGEALAPAERSAAQSAPPASSESPTVTSQPHRDPDVVKREVIIRQNSGVSTQGLCTILDNEHVPVPKGWVAQTWTQAYKSAQDKSHVQVILSKAKRTDG